MRSEIFNRPISQKLKICISCWYHTAVADNTVHNSSGLSIHQTHHHELEIGLNSLGKVNWSIYYRIFKAIYP